MFFTYVDTRIELLNQVCAGHRPACTWFLKVDPVRIVGMCACVCPLPRLLITSSHGMMWHDIDLICVWLSKLYSCYITVVVVIINGHGLGFGTCHRH